MAKRNTWDGFCGVCRCEVRAFEGIVQDLGRGKGYRLLCVEHAPPGTLDSPDPPEASKLPSIYGADERYER